MFKKNKLPLEFNVFEKEDFIKKENWEQKVVFILDDWIFVNGSIKCVSGSIEVFYDLEITPKNLHGKEIKYYMVLS